MTQQLQTVIKGLKEHNSFSLDVGTRKGLKRLYFVKWKDDIHPWDAEVIDWNQYSPELWNETTDEPVKLSKEKLKAFRAYLIEQEEA